MPDHFSNFYRTPDYWKKGNQKELDPPATPEHLPRFLDIELTPRIKKTQASVQRTLITDAVQRHQRHWLRVNPIQRFFFEYLIGPKSNLVILPGTYQVFEPIGPGPWDNQYIHCKTSVLFKTSNNPYSSGDQIKPDSTILEKEHTWE